VDVDDYVDLDVDDCVRGSSFRKNFTCPVSVSYFNARPMPCRASLGTYTHLPPWASIRLRTSSFSAGSVRTSVSRMIQRSCGGSYAITSAANEAVVRRPSGK